LQTCPYQGVSILTEGKGVGLEGDGVCLEGKDVGLEGKGALPQKILRFSGAPCIGLEGSEGGEP